MTEFEVVRVVIEVMGLMIVMIGSAWRAVWALKKYLAAEHKKIDDKVEERHQETQGKLTAIDNHLTTLNGQVAENTKRSVANEAVLRERGI